MSWLPFRPLCQGSTTVHMVYLTLTWVWCLVRAHAPFSKAQLCVSLFLSTGEMGDTQEQLKKMLRDLEKEKDVDEPLPLMKQVSLLELWCSATAVCMTIRTGVSAQPTAVCSSPGLRDHQMIHVFSPSQLPAIQSTFPRGLDWEALHYIITRNLGAWPG